MGLRYEANWAGLQSYNRPTPSTPPLSSVNSTIATSFEYIPQSKTHNLSSSSSNSSSTSSLSSSHSPPTNKKNVSFEEDEFLIPRPKLIVPVHTYGIRKRRTGIVIPGRTGSDGSETDRRLHQDNLPPAVPIPRAQHKSCPGLKSFFTF
ncbi:hypothetical protein O3M35_009233 [Rhynocoris fuscipes]|uniref:Uncharacterized protein n=1 Tax=Rhynocoris fuscipes TaxID=488301 RepID=A0AAW1D839_9HEMI